ncbi:S1 RNA-binding domain-containing protein, partial [Microbacterium sp. 3H14]
SKGEIIFIHKNGRFGKIKCTDESVINFTKNSFNKAHHRIDKFKNAEISFVSDYDYKADPIAENIKIITLKKEDEIIGEIFKGKVQNIVDFGIFIDFDSGKSGLSHISV